MKKLHLDIEKNLLRLAKDLDAIAKELSYNEFVDNGGIFDKETRIGKMRVNSNLVEK